MAEAEIPTMEEAVVATTVPPNPDSPPPTSTEPIVDTGVPVDPDTGAPLNTAPLEPTNEEKMARNLTTDVVVGAPEVPYDDMLDIHKRVRNTTAEEADGAPSPEAPPGVPADQAPTVVDVPYIEQVVDKMTCTLGNWTGEPTSRTYQWQRDGADVGTGTPEYYLSAADVGTTITCIMTATNAIGTSEPVTSNAVIVE